MSNHFAIDISNNSIKVLQVSPAKIGFELMAFGETTTPASLQSTNPKDEAMIEGAVKELLQKAKIRTKEVYLSIPESYVYSRVIQLPNLKDAEVRSAIKYESEQYIPIPLEEVYLEYQILYRPPPNSKKEKMNVLLIASRKTMVEKLLTLTQNIELSPLVMETSLIAGMRALRAQLTPYSILVDIGDTSTDLAILQDNHLQQISSITTGGEALTRAIARNLNLTPAQAKQYKHTYGLDQSKLEGKVAKAMQDPISEIMNHIKKSVQFIENESKNSRIDQLILSGGTALLPQLTTQLLKTLNKEVILANPLKDCQNPSLPKVLESSSPRFSSVIGLAIRK